MVNSKIQAAEEKEKNILTLQQDLLCQDLDMIIKN